MNPYYNVLTFNLLNGLKQKLLSLIPNNLIKHSTIIEKTLVTMQLND